MTKNAAVLAALSADPYDRGDSDFTVTEVLQEPWMIWLRRKLRAAGELKPTPPEKRHWSMYGQIVHGILERAAAGLVGDQEPLLIEKRLYGVVTVGQGRTYRLGGQVDLLDSAGVLWDFKFTSVMKSKYSDPNHARQLLLLAWLCSVQDPPVKVKAVKNCYIYRDWRKGESERGDDYPEPIEDVDHRFTASSTAKAMAGAIETIEAVTDCELGLRGLSKCKSTWNGIRCSRYCDVVEACDKQSRVAWSDVDIARKARTDKLKGEKK